MEGALGRRYVTVRVGGEDVDITWPTRRELLRLLQRAPGTLHVVLHFENIGAGRSVQLDRDGNERLFGALTFWLDHPTPGKPLPDDARALWTALANDLQPDGQSPGNRVG